MNRTISRAVEILEMIAKDKNGMTLKEISDHLGIPKSSTFEIVQTLVQLKMADTSFYNDKKYILGSKAFALGMQYVNRSDVVNLGAFYLKNLAEKFRRTGFMGMLDDTKVVYVYKWQPANAKLTACELGTRQELYCTSLGKALLAYSHPELLMSIVDRIKFVAKTEHTIMDKETLLQELELTKKRGYSIDNREVENHMMCFGAPIFDYIGKVIAAISISDLYDENLTDYDSVGLEVRAVADLISSRLGYNK